MTGAQAFSCLASSRARTSKTVPQRLSTGQHRPLQVWGSGVSIIAAEWAFQEPRWSYKVFLGPGLDVPNIIPTVSYQSGSHSGQSRRKAYGAEESTPPLSGGSAGRLRGQGLVVTALGIGCHNQRFIFLHSIGNI